MNDPNDQSSGQPPPDPAPTVTAPPPVDEASPENPELDPERARLAEQLQAARELEANVRSATRAQTRAMMIGTITAVEASEEIAPRLYPALARCVRHYYTALMNEGFTAEEALRLAQFFNPVGALGT